MHNILQSEHVWREAEERLQGHAAGEEAGGHPPHAGGARGPAQRGAGPGQPRAQVTFDDEFLLMIAWISIFFPILSDAYSSALMLDA